MSVAFFVGIKGPLSKFENFMGSQRTKHYFADVREGHISNPIVLNIHPINAACNYSALSERVMLVQY